jgi:FkbM family methyltransferase
MGLINETAKVLKKTGLCRYFSISSKHGFSVRFYPTRISKRLWVDSFKGGSKYAKMDQFFIDYLDTGDTVIDVGANIGWYTLLSSVRVGEYGRVYSFEAHPTTFAYLIGNIRMNELHNIHPYESALGNNHSTVQFSDDRKDDMNKVARQGKIAVQVNPLDAFEIQDEIALLKIDVEGFEWFVLQGASKVLAKTETIIFEVWATHMQPYDYTFEDIYSLLTETGFTILEHTSEGFTPVTRDYDATEIADLVAVRDVASFHARMGRT